MEKEQKNALVLANWLKEQNIVTKVIYPGLKDHPGHENDKVYQGQILKVLLGKISAKNP